MKAFTITPHDTLKELALNGAEYRNWYRHAERSIREAAACLRAAGRKCSDKRLAELLALFSPRVSVSRNVKFALHYITYDRFASDVTRSVRAAVEHYEITGDIRGPKTGPFAKALLGDGSAIVLDTHMASALGMDQRLFSTQYGWDAAAQAVSAVAYDLGWSNAETQAAIWAGWLLTAPDAVRESGRRIRSTIPDFDVIGTLREMIELSDLP